VQLFGFHSIRHLSASILYSLGYDLATIQMILRHKNAGTTERYLKSLGLEKAREALEDLSGRRGKVLPFGSSHVQVNGVVLENKKPSREPSSPSMVRPNLMVVTQQA
jgi:site-specific recombinase XerD